MMRRTLLFSILMFAGFSGLLRAQPGPVSIRPDCFQFFTFTATGNALLFDNRSAGCPYFAITYTSNGFTGVSLVLQVAPDAGGTPGTFATYTANSGINPNTSTTQAFSTFSGYFPWLRVQLTSIVGSGSIQGIMYGWRTPADVIANGGTTGGCVGTAATPCVVDGPTAAGSPATTPPVLVAGADTGNNVRSVATNAAGAVYQPSTTLTLLDGRPIASAQVLQMLNTGGLTTTPTLLVFPYVMNGNLGTTMDRQFDCPLSANITLTTSGLTRIITGTASDKIHICSISIAFASPVDIQVVEGTQAVTACDTGAANMTGLFRQVTGFDPNLSNLNPLTEATTADDICISMGANVNGGGVAKYAVF